MGLDERSQSLPGDRWIDRGDGEGARSDSRHQKHRGRGASRGESAQSVASLIHAMPLGLYIHLPFCRVHCTYCPFAVSTDIALQDRYTDALIAEVDARAGGERVDSIFFGGGTPSRTSREKLVRIVARLRERFAIDNDAEFSLEANPEDVTDDAVSFWRTLGVNRLSIGVQ